MRVAGLISGTSVDGIDVAVVDIGERIEVVTLGTAPYPEGVREAILGVSNAPTHTGEIARLNFVLGELFAEAVKGCGVALDTIELIGSHGQTIFHEGEPRELFGYRVASTMQIGEPAVIAERTGIPVVADFRPSDIAAGGKGAPLVPYLDYMLFRDAAMGRVALNIGGIANITVIPRAAAPSGVVAFDTGPGNMIMDGLTGSYDRDGALARRGKVDLALLERLMADPYYRRTPPKTAGREQYGKEFLSSLPKLPLEDLVATAAELTARTIADAIHRYADIGEAIVSGGGAHNSYLMERLRAELRPQLRMSSELGIDVDGKEAIAFAVLAHETWHGRPASVPSATGARKPAILGKIAYPSRADLGRNPLYS